MKHNHDRQSGSNFHAFLPLIPPFPPCRFRSQPILIRDANNIFAFRRGLQHFDDFAISMNHLRIFPIFVLSQRDRNESPNFSPIKFFLLYPPLLRLRMIKEKKGTKIEYYMPINTTMSSLRRIRCITVAQSRKRVSMQFHEYVTTRNYEYLDDSSTDSSTRYFFLLFFIVSELILF